jgi:hypothetical protein
MQDAYVKLNLGIPTQKWHSSKKKTLFTSKEYLNLKKELVKCYIWSKPFYGAEIWKLKKIDQI